MSTLPAELRDGKIGRVPVWAIGVILAGAVLLFMVFRNRGKTKAPATTDTGPLYDTQMEDSVYGLPPGAIGGYLDTHPLDPAYPVGLTPTGIPGPVTNVQWSRLAFDWLIGQGNDPALVERALAKYIQGSVLDAQERAIINLAERAFGAPPEGLIISDPTPTPIPGPTPTGPVFSKVKKGEGSDQWINQMTQVYGVYWGQLIVLNPSLPANISLNKDPSKRVFLADATYRVK